MAYSDVQFVLSLCTTSSSYSMCIFFFSLWYFVYCFVVFCPMVVNSCSFLLFSWHIHGLSFSPFIGPRCLFYLCIFNRSTTECIISQHYNSALSADFFLFALCCSEFHHFDFNRNINYQQKDLKVHVYSDRNVHHIIVLWCYDDPLPALGDHYQSCKRCSEDSLILFARNVEPDIY